MIRIFLLTGLVCLALTKPVMAQVSGCTDPAANNYNSLATVNNGTCTYNSVSLTPILKATLSSDLSETSGIIFWNNRLWSHNDSGNPPEIIELDTTGTVIRKIAVSNATNIDWEDIAQDLNYVYIGDFGNNSSGNRQNLRIYRILKSAILAGNTVTAEIINFSYADQTDFTAVAGNTTNFDCESMIIFNGKIYLFTKQWTALGTSLYEVNNSPGTQIANRIGSSTSPAGLVTGADVMEDKRSIALCGYTSGGARFLYLLYDFQGNNFFSGNKRYVGINNLGQTEGIAFRNPEFVYISRENLVRVILGVPVTIAAQGLETVNLTTLLSPYYLLPIEFIDLTVQKTDLGARLKWSIIPDDEFKQGWLQRKTGLQQEYKDVQTITQPKGMTDDINNGTLNGVIHYRIKAVDIDGRESYSKEVKTSFANKQAILRFNSNVLTASLSISTLKAKLELYDAMGARVAVHEFVGKLDTDLASKPQGVYIAIIRSGNGEILQQLRFVK